MAAAVFKNSYSLDIKNSALFASGVFFAGVGRRQPRRHPFGLAVPRTGNVRLRGSA